GQPRDRRRRRDRLAGRLRRGRSRGVRARTGRRHVRRAGRPRAGRPDGGRGPRPGAGALHLARDRRPHGRALRVAGLRREAAAPRRRLQMVMRAIRVERHGGPEVLQPADVEAPRPGPGQVLVDVAAGGVNYVDTYHRSGLYPTALPYVPGVEGAGTVAEVGEGVAGLSPGDRGGWAASPGRY